MLQHGEKPYNTRRYHRSTSEEDPMAPTFPSVKRRTERRCCSSTPIERHPEANEDMLQFCSVDVLPTCQREVENRPGVLNHFGSVWSGNSFSNKVQRT